MRGFFSKSPKDRSSTAQALQAILDGADDVSLTHQYLGDDGVMLIAQALGQNRTVKTLQLDDTSIAEGAIAPLIAAMAEGSILQSLDLGCNQLGDAGMSSLAQYLKGNATLKSLSLRSVSVSDAGFATVASAMETNTSLTDLSLGCNQCTDIGASHMANALRVNSTLQTLRLEDNQIKDLGISLLGDALKRNQTLRVLWILNNPITNDGVACFARAMEDNNTLKRFGFTIDKDSLPRMLAGVKSLRLNNVVRKAIFAAAGLQEGGNEISSTLPSAAPESDKMPHLLRARAPNVKSKPRIEPQSEVAGQDYLPGLDDELQSEVASVANASGGQDLWGHARDTLAESLTIEMDLAEVQMSVATPGWNGDAKLEDVETSRAKSVRMIVAVESPHWQHVKKIEEDASSLELADTDDEDSRRIDSPACVKTLQPHLIARSISIPRHSPRQFQFLNGGGMVDMEHCETSDCRVFDEHGQPFCNSGCESPENAVCSIFGNSLPIKTLPQFFQCVPAFNVTRV